MARSSDPKKRSLWQRRFRRFVDSGSAVARFCVVERVSESSFYYWRKRLGARALRRPARAKGRDACSEDRGVRAEGRDTCSEDGHVFQPVTVVPGVCGVLVRLPGGTQIEVGAEHLDAIRAVVAETVRVDRSREPDRSWCPRCRADHGRAADRNAASDNQIIRKASSDNQVIRKRGGSVSC